MTDIEPNRRNLLAGLAAAGVAVPLLAACGSGTNDATGTTGSADGIKAADIPVGGGKIFADDKVVVTQPAAGEFKAFTAVCTHQGCIVANVEDGTINCTCHGSKFSIADGSVEKGPATRALAEKTVKVTDNSLTVS